MNAMNDILLPNEKRLLGRLGLIALCLLAAGIIFFVRIRGYHAGLERGNAEAAGRIAAAKAKVEEASSELERWRRAGLDIASVKSERLFRKESAVQDIRLALQEMLDKAGSDADSLDFSYQPAERKRLGKVTVSFGFSGSYETLKRLLGTIEADPRFLTVERIDFPNNWNGKGPMKVKFTLAGYHEI